MSKIILFLQFLAGLFAKNDQPVLSPIGIPVKAVPRCTGIKSSKNTEFFKRPKSLSDVPEWTHKTSTGQFG